MVYTIWMDSKLQYKPRNKLSKCLWQVTSHLPQVSSVAKNVKMLRQTHLNNKIKLPKSIAFAKKENILSNILYKSVQHNATIVYKLKHMI